MASDPSGNLGLGLTILCGLVFGGLGELVSDIIDDRRVNNNIVNYVGAIIAAGVIFGVYENDINSFNQGVGVRLGSVLSTSISCACSFGMTKFLATLNYNSIVKGATHPNRVNNLLKDAGLNYKLGEDGGKSGIISKIMKHDKFKNINDLFKIKFDIILDKIGYELGF